MKSIFGTAMRNAAKLTQSRHVVEATQVIRRALEGRNTAHTLDQQPASNLRLIEPKAAVGTAQREPPFAGNASADWQEFLPNQGLARATQPLSEVLALLRQQIVSNLPLERCLSRAFRARRRCQREQFF